jgi:SAM-dependent methyltransferase
MAGTTDSTTSAVADLYEDYPYPAHGVVSDVVARMLLDVVATARRRVQGRRVRLLDAGCGTGEQTVGIARRYPDLEIAGIDLSNASLGFARRLGEKHGVQIRFERRDLMLPIEDLGRFDVIVSVGTLHHLADPQTGFRNLRQVAEEGAAFLGMVYGTYGRWETFRVRDALNSICGPEATRAERLAVLQSARLANNTGFSHYLEILRRRLRFGPDLRIIEAARRVLGGRNAAYQADAFTHVREVAFTWAELDTVLTESGWGLRGWPRRSGMPDDPSQLFSGQALESLRNRSLVDLATIYERVVCPSNLFFLATASRA